MEAYLTGWLVFGRINPLSGLFGCCELDNHQYTRLPISFKHFGLAACGKHLTYRCNQGGIGKLPILHNPIWIDPFRKRQVSIEMLS